MLLLVLSILETLVLFIIGAIAFFFLGKYFGSRSFSGISADHASLLADHQNLQKQYKARQKGISHIENDRDTATSNYQELQTEFERYKLNDSANKSRYAELQNEVVTLRGEKDKSTRSIEDLQSRLDAANDKFKSNQKDSKTWRHELDALKRSEKDLRMKLNSSQSTTKKLKEKLASISSAESELEQLRLDMKANQKELKRLTKDCQYWEKQHYDTHHKLATSLENIEELKAAVQNEKLEKQGLEIKEENMLKTLADFKKKLIYANERYHNLSQQEVQN